MSKKWTELGNNGTVGAQVHNLKNFKDWLALQRVKTNKTVVKEDKTKEKEKEVKLKNVSEKRQRTKKERNPV